MDALPENKRFTYSDYLTWDNHTRYELIDGIPYMMAPPSSRHQRIVGELHGQLWQFLKGKPCKVFLSPFGVRLNADSGDDHVVEPDIVVVCDKTKIDDRGCVGAPDLIIEVLSASNEAHDTVVKFNKYLWAGVREYWIVNPYSRSLSVHILRDGEYMTRAYLDTDAASASIPVHVLDGCAINMADVFAEQ